MASPAPLPYFPMDPIVDTAVTDIAGYWWRVLGYVIDGLIVTIAVEIISNATNLGFYPTRALSIFISLFYFTLLVAYWNGQTLGMKICRMRCVNVEDRGAVTLQRAFIRAIFYTVLLAIASIYHFRSIAHPTTAQAHRLLKKEGILFLFSIPLDLDLLWAAWDKKRQTLHDKVARTIVIRPARSV